MAKIRETIRTPIRKNLNNKGPEYIPPEVRDLFPGYQLGWILYNDKNPYTLETRLQRGWEPIPASLVPDCTSLMDKYQLGTCYNVADGKHICRRGKDGMLKYLMKISQENFNAYLEEHNQEVDRSEESMNRQLANQTDKQSGFSRENPDQQQQYHYFQPGTKPRKSKNNNNNDSNNFNN